MTLARSGLQLVGLSAFAFGWPYLDPLRTGGDFFIERGAGGADVVLFALLFLIGPAAAMLLAEALLGFISHRARDVLHLVFIGGLGALFAWQVVDREGAVAAVLELACGAGLAWGFARAAVVRTWLTVLGIAPFVMLLAFLVFSPLQPLAFGGDGPNPYEDLQGGSGAPVVVLVLDELPTVSLLDRHGRIDADRYPGFASLASDATWYRDAASVADETQVAVPAILSGSVGPHDALGISAEHPHNLFTLLGGRYRLDESEAVTDLCGKHVCEEQIVEPFRRRMRTMVSDALELIPALPFGLRTRAADAVRSDAPSEPPSAPEDRDESVRWLEPLAQPDRFERFMENLSPGRRRLHFLHLVLPHGPWTYLPDGRTYSSRQVLREEGPDGVNQWPGAPRIRDLGWQRHLLEVQYVDRLVGRLIDRLRALGLYDDALVVLVADHGEAFVPGEPLRRVSRATVAELASVPMFVKAPGQRRGRISNADVSTTDALPTIAAELGVTLPWKIDGRPAGERTQREPPLSMLGVQSGERVVIGRAALARERAAAAASLLRVFEDGDPYRFRSGAAVLGREVVRAAPAERLRATLDEPSRYEAVDRSAPYVPADVSGAISGGRPSSRPLAIAVNGRVVSTPWSFVVDGTEVFSAVVPLTAFRNGRNAVRIYVRAGGGRLVELVRPDGFRPETSRR